jgi:hypothetical protein
MAGPHQPTTKWYSTPSLVLALTALGLSGCSSKGSVSGKVYYKDKEVTSGVVTFMQGNRSLGTATIQPDGSYSLKSIAKGEATIIVVAGAPPAGGNSSAKANPITLPKKYSDPAQSPLKLTVKSGSNEFDIRME